MGAIDMFNDFVKLIESKSCPSKPLRLRMATPLSRNVISFPTRIAIFIPIRKVMFRRLSALRLKMACCHSIRDWSTRSPVCSLRCATGVGSNHAEALADYVERFQSCIFDEP